MIGFSFRKYLRTSLIVTSGFFCWSTYEAFKERSWSNYLSKDKHRRQRIKDEFLMYSILNLKRSTILGILWPISVPFSVISLIRPEMIGLDFKQVKVPVDEYYVGGDHFVVPKATNSREWAKRSLTDPFYDGDTTYDYLFSKIKSIKN